MHEHSTKTTAFICPVYFYDMQHLVVVSPSLYLRGPLVDAEIFPDERSFLQIKNENVGRARIKVRMLVDTGSNISGLRRTLIERLQLPMYHEKARIDGAGGIFSLDLFRCVLYLDIFGQKALPLDIVEGDFEQSAYDGVIGRDVLQYCKLEFDGPSNAFRLSAPGF
jgi:hypothetical protein